MGAEGARRRVGGEKKSSSSHHAPTNGYQPKESEQSDSKIIEEERIRLKPYGGQKLNFFSIFLTCAHKAPDKCVSQTLPVTIEKM